MAEPAKRAENGNAKSRNQLGKDASGFHVRVATANDSSSATAEGGGAWRAGCAAGLRGAASVTRAAAPEQFSAAPLLAVSWWK